MNLSMLHAVVRGLAREDASPETSEAFAQLSHAEQKSVRAWLRRRQEARSQLGLTFGTIEVLEWMAIPTALPSSSSTGE